MEKSNASRNGIRHFFRVLRPLVWWLILVLVLYGIRTHQRLLERTRLDFSVSLQGWPIAATATLDGNPALSGQKISLGNHRFSIAYPKAEPFSTNLFIWYGAHDLGDIQLKRSMGTLHVQATPSASSITISGPEFSTNLYDSGGITLSMPTDKYTLRAEYPHWSQTQNSTVMANLTASCVFAPRLGALYITCNKDDATYRLESGNGQSVDSGSLPATVAGLPVGEYEMTVLYHHRQIRRSVVVETGVTNEVPVEFTLGAARLETTPAGAGVRTADGNYLGRTPLVVADMTPQTTQFNFSLAGYEPVLVTVDITADQTNVCRTNLVSIGYVSAMQEARSYLAASNFEAAMQAAGGALNAKPGDTDALALQAKASGYLNAERERQERKQREAELAAQERERKLKELQASFNVLLAPVEDSARFAEHELSATNDAGAVGVAIKNALADGQSSFRIIRFEQPQSGIFALQARQLLGVGYRDCFIVGETVADGETRILFKSVEYDHPPQLKLLGGLVTATARQAPTPAEQARFQQQIREGAPMVEARIRQAIGETGSF